MTEVPRNLRHNRVNDIILFFLMYESVNYADDCNMYSSNKNINNIMISLNHYRAILSNWFYKIFMVHDPIK